MQTEKSFEERKETVIKGLAIVGVIALAILVLWALVQAVRLAPGAFGSLASITDSLYGDEVELRVNANKVVVNTGEPFFVTWSTVNRTGTYAFTYECTDGVSAEVRESSEITDLTCGNPYTITNEEAELEVIFESEKGRFVDVPYSVSFTRNDSNVSNSDDARITVVNATIAQSDEVRDDVDDEVDDTNATSTDETIDTPSGNTGGTGVPSGTTRTVPVTSTSFPTSNPNGTVNLRLSYIGIGSLDDDDDYTPRSTLDNDRTGALRFEVKNIGTKTSDEWSFTAKLPTQSGTTYESPDQDELRPNERAIITLGFENLGDARDDEVEVEIEGGDDDTANNNSFKWDVEITN